MATYIVLYKLTDQGIKNIKDAPKRIEETIRVTEAMGSKLLSFFSVMGEYDYVSINEIASDEAAMTALLALGSAGNVRTTTLKAFTKEDFTKIVGNLP